MNNYQTLVREGKIRPDPNQQVVIKTLDEYGRQITQQQNKLMQFKKEYSTIANPTIAQKIQVQKQQEQQGGFFGFFSSQQQNQPKSEVKSADHGKRMIHERYKELDQLKGIYLWGDPGCGKTFIMDHFYDNLGFTEKKKLHYNEFMLQVHQVEHELNKKLAKQQQDTITIVGNNFSQNLILLCVDEFQVLDIADAMILKRLLESFWENKMIIFLTSNRSPDDLYIGGLQRYLFMPVIELLKEKCHVINMNSIDYRLLHAMGMDSYYYPTGKQTEKQIQIVWDSLTNNSVGTPTVINVAQGRTLGISKHAKNVAEVEFQDLCETAKGSTDYMALAQNFQTIIIRGIPKLTLERRDILRRFILLVDQLYYFHRKVIIEAEASLDELFDRPQQSTGFDEEFAYDRCLSRLKEMQTKEYQEENLMHKHM